VEVVVLVAGQASAAVRLAYGRPRIGGVTLDRTVAQPLMDCAVVAGDGTPAPGNLGAPNATILVQGVNFGAGEATQVTVGGVPCALVRCAHATLSCVTPMCVGE
jgi:hypothetical protein